MPTATPHRRQAFRISAPAGVALACLLTLLPAVLAASPQRLAGPITDDVSALGGSTSGVQATLDDLQQATGAQLWVWYTDTLGGQVSSDFAAATAQASGLGTTDVLLVIALNDRAYGYWKGDNVKISDADLERWQQTYRYLLQKVAVANNGKQLLLKNPAHSGRLPTILKMFPNARFIHVYRNPFVVIASTLKLLDRFLHLLALQRHDWDSVREACLVRYQLLMECLLRDKELIPPNQLFEVSHEEMTSRPLDVLERAYSHLSLPGFDTAQPRLQSYVESLANYETNRYGFDDATIDHWAPFLKVALDRWGYEPPDNRPAMSAANPAA